MITEKNIATRASDAPAQPRTGGPKSSRGRSPRRLASLVVAAVALAVFAGGCSTKKQVSVPPRLTPLVDADTPRLFEEVNRAAGVRSLRGKVDVQFLDTSFAECGVIDKYRTAEGTIITQRPGQVYVSISFFSVKIAEMTSDGERFRVALYQGEDKYKRFVTGTNTADYSRLPGNGDLGAAAGQKPDCGGGDAGQKQRTMLRTVSSLSSLRPQHFTDALLVRPASPEGSKLLYAVSESFEEEPDPRPNAKKSARVVRGYYVMVELEPTGGTGARVLRRFWFDRVGEIRLARVQNFGEAGRLVTDVVYRDPKPFGSEGRYRLPAEVELTRPQEGYSVRINFQSPEDATLDKAWDTGTFILQNTSNLPEVDLDKN